MFPLIVHVAVVSELRTTAMPKVAQPYPGRRRRRAGRADRHRRIASPPDGAAPNVMTWSAFAIWNVCNCCGAAL
jgi:hypothetical protein